MHLPEDGHVSDRNVYEVYYIFNVLSYTYVHLLVLLPYLHPILFVLLFRVLTVHSEINGIPTKFYFLDSWQTDTSDEQE
jgi:hypothetical protein